jgi:hypothetical protein
MVVVITSPDIISIGMFTDFLRKKFLPGCPMVNLNALMSEQYLTSIAEDSLKRHPDGVIFRHKTRRRMQPAKVPSILQEKADCMVGFDLYSTHAEVLKSFPGWTDSVVQAWSEHVDRMNKS